MGIKELLAIIAALLAVIGNVPYLRDTWKGSIQPRPYTWLVGSIVSGTVFFGMLEKGAGIGSLPVAVSEAFTIIIFLFSLKFGFKKITTSDRLFLGLALAGLVPWFLTKDPTWSVVSAVCVDLLSLVPTFRKTWKYPRTESSLLYGTNVIKHMLLLLSLSAYNVATMLHSIAMITSNTALVATIYRARAR